VLDGDAPVLDGAAPVLDGAAPVLDGDAPVLDGDAPVLDGDGAVLDDVAGALHDAGLGGWASALPAGLDSVIDPDGRGDGGAAGLSAGEAQLLALARALRRRPDIVVLDEATSRVDPATEAAIRQATERRVRGRTAIEIAHRLETLEVCDDIAVMADGRLVEHGPRAALAADPTSAYARLLATAAADEVLS
jgi:ABC-type multidrug transport system fused ATPase/permease subunit